MAQFEQDQKIICLSPFATILSVSETGRGVTSALWDLFFYLKGRFALQTVTRFSKGTKTTWLGLGKHPAFC